MRVLIALILMMGTVYAGEVPQRPLFAPSGTLSSAQSSMPGILGTPAAVTSTHGVGSFMYFAPDKWSFWWQGQRVTPQNIPSGMTDVDISPNAVRFTYGGTQHDYPTGKFN